MISGIEAEGFPTFSIVVIFHGLFKYLKGLEPIGCISNCQIPAYQFWTSGIRGSCIITEPALLALGSHDKERRLDSLSRLQSTLKFWFLMSSSILSKMLITQLVRFKSSMKASTSLLLGRATAVTSRPSPRLRVR